MYQAKHTFVSHFLRVAAPAMILGAFFLPGIALANTMTFGTLVSGSNSYSEDGLDIATTGQFFVSTFESIAPSMFPSAVDNTITLTLAGGGPFTLNSMDIRELNGNVGVQSVVFEGTLMGGGTVSHTVTTDGVCCAAFAPNGYQTFVFPATFTNLTSVSWDQLDPTAFCVYDNIVVNESTVPVEAATWGRLKSLYADQ